MVTNQQVISVSVSIFYITLVVWVLKTTEKNVASKAVRYFLEDQKVTAVLNAKKLNIMCTLRPITIQCSPQYDKPFRR